MTEVTIIDYGLGNLYSVRRALEHCGASVIITKDPAKILSATHIILPGVGAFGNAMQELQRLRLIGVLQYYASSGRHLLGICLGAQLLLDQSVEFGFHQGLSMIPGRVVPLVPTTIQGDQLKIPHIGWNSLVPSEGRLNWTSSLLSDVKIGDAVYFVHSFMAEPERQTDRLADCLYGGRRIAAVIQHGNVVGCQFHPEKSGKIGLKIIDSFCGLV
jgi:glutamine amidotransferase